ncbi:MAG TPA: TerC family protein [Nitrospirota bacterium]|nr:TerC family protein [Nitrospirota bacterium]
MKVRIGLQGASKKAGVVDLSALGTARFDVAFLSGIFSIVLIDLILAGDNAVVIAMAVRSLPKEQRRKGILFGSAAAVLLRIILTFFVAQILNMSYVKLVGGLVIIWIAIKLFVEDEEAVEAHKEAATLWHAIRLIVIADITMALDNMLAVGAASHGNLFLLIFGLGLSIPFIVFTSSLLSMLMDKFPIIIYIGSALLGKIGGEMIMTDPVIAGFITPPKTLTYSVEIFSAVGVLVVGRFWLQRDLAKQAQAGPPSN